MKDEQNDKWQKWLATTDPKERYRIVRPLQVHIISYAHSITALSVYIPCLLCIL